MKRSGKFMGKYGPFLLYLGLLGLVVVISTCQDSVSPQVAVTTAPHPRLLLKIGEEEEVKSWLGSDPIWNGSHLATLQEANRVLGTQPLKRKLTGRRLLGVSREAIQRIYYWSYAYRMTRDKRFAARAEQEMRIIASFTDWNPSHFLDVAEMTLALAIGYDWLYSELSPESKIFIADAIA